MSRKDLVDLLFAGGLTVETPRHDKPDCLSVRTVIQVDGDIIIYIDPGVDVNSADWIAHMNEVRQRISSVAYSVGIFQKVIHRALFVVVTAAGYLATWAVGVDSSWGIEWWGPIMGALVIRSFLARIVPGFASGVLQFLLRLVGKRGRSFLGFGSRLAYER